MADCPNCGRQAFRTKDWACQWCGYPLISNAFKVIDKTYKELQEERLNVSKQNRPQEKSENKTERQPAPAPRIAPPRKPAYKPRPEPESLPQPPNDESALAEPITQSITIQPEPTLIPEPVEPEPTVINLTEANAEPTPTPEPVVENPPEPTVMITPPPQSEVTPEPVQAAAPEPEPGPPPQPEPVIEPQPEPEPEPSIKPEDITDDMELMTEEINLLFRKDKERADNGLTGKTIIIRGVVDKVFVRDHLDIRYIMLTNAKKNMNWNLRCTFNKEESSKLGRLQEGQEALVRGTYDGYSKNIIFKDCALV
jgi:hypothetical protein